MKNVAIVAGGDSSEYEVSLRSAQGLMGFIPDEYRKFVVLVTADEWSVIDEKEPIVAKRIGTIDKNDFSATINGKKVKFDYAYITIHGTPGENGIFQGYLDLVGIPFSTCDVTAASLTFDKFVCNNYLRSFGLNVAKSFRLLPGESITTDKVVSELGLPVFVKPSVGGSSFGVTKVKKADELQPAIEKAFKEGKEVMIEAFMKGVEVTNGMYRTSKVERVFPVTEVVTSNEFFDYDAKYNGQVDEITPARISDELTRRIQETTRKIYGLVGAHGIVRVDYIITEGDKINFLEVNTTPGMTATSFIPQQVRAAGLDIKDVMREIIED